MQNFSPDEMKLREEKHLKRSDDKIGTAIPLTFFFLLLLSTIILGQHLLSKKNTSLNTINITFERLEQQEEIDNVESFNNLTQANQLEIEIIAIQYLNGKLKIEEIRSRMNDIESTEPNEFAKKIAALINRLIEQKKYTSALPIFQYLTKKQITSLKMSFRYAQTLSKTNQTEKAIAEYESLLKLNPKHQAALVNLGLLLLSNHQPLQAYSVFSKGLTFDSGVHKAKIHAGLGDSQMGLKKPKEALLSFQKSIEYRPTSSLTWKKLARTQRELKMPVKVVSLSYQKALSLQPSNSRLASEFANYLFHNMLFKQTTELLRNHLRQSKTSISERLLIVISYLELQRSANAKKQLSYLKKYVSRRKQKMFADSLGSYLQGNFENSLAGFKASLKKNRDNNLAYYMIGQTYFAQNKPKNAAIYFNKVLQNSFFYNIAQYRLGMTKIIHGKTDEAKNIFNRLFARLPQNIDIAFQVAKLAYANNDSVLAHASISKAILGSPDKKDYRLLEAKIKWRMGERENVFDLLKSILKQHPTYKPAIYRLADYYSRMKKFQDAVSHFSNLLEIDPDYSNTQFRLAVLLSANLSANTQSKIKALQLVQDYLQRNSADVKARLFDAKLLCELKKMQECQHQLMLVNKFEPDNKEAQSIKMDYFGSLTQSN
ncbi:MAG: hypothetical protein COA74_05150 [Gammaproteobacteria bacterium]|nr:MAG: hypothetical protein COA74_05150 [Gammaproteobacteria bacterium]